MSPMRDISGVKQATLEVEIRETAYSGSICGVARRMCSED